MSGLRRAGVAAVVLCAAGCANEPPLSSMLDTAPAREAAGTTLALADGAAPAPASREQYYATELREAWAAFDKGDYERAMLGYERVVARAEEPRIQIRALISLAMIRMLPSSKMQDDVAARVVLDELERRIESSGLRYEFFGEIELLELLAKQDQELLTERAKSDRLRKDLAARDAVIKKLRALSVETQ